MAITARTTPDPYSDVTCTPAQVIAECQRLVEPQLRAALAILPAPILEIVNYHFGWLDPPTSPHSADRTPEGAMGRGKAIRPALVLACALAVGGDTTAALPAAVSVELVHNFSLLHDDVMDADLTRRHRPTAWSVFGSSAAILAGDALLMLAFDVLAATDHQRGGQAIRWLAATVADLIAGQHADISFEQRDDVRLDECLAMARGKTAALLSCSCALGALFGGAEQQSIERLRRFGQDLGLAFQHIDDLLGIWADPRLTGKPVYSDLRNAKKSLPVVAALTAEGAAALELASRYRSGPITSEAELARTAALIEQAGGRAYSQTQADQLLTSALAHLHDARPTANGGRWLRALAQLATHRDH